MTADLEMLWTFTKALRQPMQRSRPSSNQSKAKQQRRELQQMYRKCAKRCLFGLAVEGDALTQNGFNSTNVSLTIRLTMTTNTPV